MSYLRIHHDLKFAIQSEIVTREQLPMMPSSTFYNIRTSDYSSLLGPEAAGLDPSAFALAKRAARITCQTASAVIRCKNKLIHILKGGLNLSSIVKKLVRKSSQLKEQLVRTIENTRQHISLKHACRIFSISVHQFHAWARQIADRCPSSPTGICPKRHSLAISPQAIQTIKTLILSPEYLGWPVYSIALDALRKNILSLCPSTWYKYKHLLGLDQQKPSSRRKDRLIGIRAERPNQYFHADVTLFRNLDRSVSYIYFLMDNFSRYILSFAVETATSAVFCLANLKNGLQKAKELHPDMDISSLHFITDGGPENKDLIHQYASDNHFTHSVALRDIVFSNSMPEALNKISKYSWLYRFDSSNHAATQALVAQFVGIYNDRRPHCSLQGLTPFEAYSGQTPPKDQWRLQKLAERQAQISKNQNLDCHVCLYNSPEYFI